MSKFVNQHNELIRRLNELKALARVDRHGLDEDNCTIFDCVMLELLERADMAAGQMMEAYREIYRQEVRS